MANVGTRKTVPRLLHRSGDKPSGGGVGQEGGISAAATRRSSATSTLYVRHAAAVVIGSRAIRWLAKAFRNATGMAVVERPRPSNSNWTPPASITGARFSRLTFAA